VTKDKHKTKNQSLLAGCIETLGCQTTANFCNLAFYRIAPAKNVAGPPISRFAEGRVAAEKSGRAGKRSGGSAIIGQ